MKNLIATLLVCLVSNFSYAGVAGSWIGWLDWSFDNTPTRCDSTMVYTQTKTSFERVSGILDCSMVRMDMGSHAWVLDQGKILEAGEVVGSFDDNHYQWSENYSETVMIKTEINLEARHMDYREKWFRKSDGMEIYYINGRLFLHE